MGGGVAQCTFRNPAPLAAHGFDVAEPQPAWIEVCVAVPLVKQIRCGPHPCWAAPTLGAIDLIVPCLHHETSPHCSLFHDHSTSWSGNCHWYNAFNYDRGVALLRFHQRSHAHLDVHFCNTVTCVDLYNCNHHQTTELSLTTKVHVTLYSHPLLPQPIPPRPLETTDRFSIWESF